MTERSDKSPDIASLTTDLEGFKDQTKRDIGRVESKVDAMFRVIDELKEAINRRGRVSWPLIVSFGVMFLALVGFLLTFSMMMTRLNLAPLEARFEQIETKLRAIEAISATNDDFDRWRIEMIHRKAFGEDAPEYPSRRSATK